MEIDIRCNGMDLMEALRAYLQRRMRFRFDRHPELIRKITVRLIEQNTSKSHGRITQSFMAIGWMPTS